MKTPIEKKKGLMRICSTWSNPKRQIKKTRKVLNFLLYPSHLTLKVLRSWRLTFTGH